MNNKLLLKFLNRAVFHQIASAGLLLLCAALPLSINGQTTISRREFSRLSVTQRAAIFQPTIERIAAEERVDPLLLWTIAYNETRFRPWLRSNAGAEGLMQFIPATAARFNLADPYQPEPAIRAAARYVRFLSARYNRRIDSILAGYNAGEGAVDAFMTGKRVRAGNKIINVRQLKTVGGVPPYRETTAYVARGLVIYRLLVERRILRGSNFSSVYPPAISESVARIQIVDPEIGVRASLWQISTASSRIMGGAEQAELNPESPDISVIPAEAVSNDAATALENHQKVVSKAEVYYEPRTGERFEINAGEARSLRSLDAGELVVTEQTLKTRNSAHARGTFFGGAPK